MSMKQISKWMIALLLIFTLLMGMRQSRFDELARMPVNVWYVRDTALAISCCWRELAHTPTPPLEAFFLYMHLRWQLRGVK